MHTSQFLRGMGLGIAVGTAIGVACMPKKAPPHEEEGPARHEAGRQLRGRPVCRDGYVTTEGRAAQSSARPSLRLRLRLHGPLPG